jgi:hypothetical protein
VDDGSDVVTPGGFLCVLLMPADSVNASVSLQFIVSGFFLALHAELLLLFFVLGCSAGYAARCMASGKPNRSLNIVYVNGNVNRVLGADQP